VRDALPLFSEHGLVAAPAWAPEAIGLAAVAIAPIVAFAHAGRASKSVPSSVGASLAAAAWPGLAAFVTPGAGAHDAAASAVGIRSAIEWPARFRGRPLTQRAQAALGDRLPASPLGQETPIAT
jgi:hypothetical protein